MRPGRNRVTPGDQSMPARRADRRSAEVGSRVWHEAGRRRNRNRTDCGVCVDTSDVDAAVRSYCQGSGYVWSGSGVVDCGVFHRLLRPRTPRYENRSVGGASV